MPRGCLGGACGQARKRFNLDFGGVQWNVHRRNNAAQQMPRNIYKEVPLTGCQLCTAPHYLLPHSFGEDYLIGEEGEVDDSDAPQLADLPWVFYVAVPGSLYYSTCWSFHRL